MIKIHPSDFYKRKTIYYSKNNFSYEVILKNKKVKILEPKDFEIGLNIVKWSFQLTLLVLSQLICLKSQ